MFSNTRGWEAARKGLSPEPLEGTGPCWLLDFRHAASRTADEDICVALSYSVCGSLYGSPRKLIDWWRNNCKLLGGGEATGHLEGILPFIFSTPIFPPQLPCILKFEQKAFKTATDTLLLYLHHVWGPRFLVLHKHYYFQSLKMA